MEANPAEIIEYAILKPEAGKTEIEKACREAIDLNLHSVVVNPYWVSFSSELLHRSETVVGSVVAYPLGATSQRVKVLETERVIADGAKEVDAVINIGALKSGDFSVIEDEISAVREACYEGITLKIILECCLLSDEEKGIACEIAERNGADYIKTSTGMNIGGATVRDVHLLRGACSRKRGIKAAGGIKTIDDVIQMCTAGATRIGTSSAVAIISDWKRRKINK